ncbi:MAG: glycosyltransferase [Gammaproteobacteria bacterium]|nr:glycosyltransferase [Gammaproteobacteria bacterium]
MSIAVVIPVYNEAPTIHNLVIRCLDVCDRIYVVDDGSTDDTIDVISALPITIIQQENNSGKGAALWRGMHRALDEGADQVITLDGDGQHRPEDIPRIVAVAEKYPDRIIIGSRLADREAFPTKRYIANRVANFWISWAAGYPISDSQSGFRLYPSSLLSRIDIDTSKASGFVFESEILIKAAQLGYQSRAVAIDAIYEPDARASYFRGVRDIARITRMVARSLITRGLYLQGFYRAMLKPHLDRLRDSAVGYDGISMLLLSVLIMLLTLGVSWIVVLFQVASRAIESESRSDGVDLCVVLGMCLIDNQPSRDFKKRLDRGLRYLQQTPGSKLYILGGYTGGDISEAAAGECYLLAKGISQEHILLEDRSRHTVENLREVRTMLPDKGAAPFLLITSRYHLARSEHIARNMQMSPQMCAAEDEFEITATSLTALLREGFFVHWYKTGRAYAKLTGNRKMLEKINS